jgi:hypothetical protein
MGEALFSHFGEVEHIEEMHRSQDENDNAEFGRDVLNALNDYPGLRPGL